MGRLQYTSEDKYQPKVLIGNWFEKNCSYTKNSHNWCTSYMIHYPPQPYSANSPDLVWDQMFRSEGYGPRILFDHEAPHYLENKSTTYDLSYNHFPKLHTKPIERHLRFRLQRYEPEQDYARNYGNITKYGLLDYYKEKWRCENQDPRTTLTTHYQDTFLPPNKEDLLFRRWAIPYPNSSILDKTNKECHSLNLRGKQLSMVPENKPIPFPHVPKCNPITWECPDVYKAVPDRCTA